MPPCSWMHCWPTKRIDCAELHLGLRQRAAPRRRLLAELERRVVAHRARQLELHLDVGDAVAQRLERGDRHAELLARVHVLDRDRDQPVHRADRLGAERGDADVDRALERRRRQRRRATSSMPAASFSTQVGAAARRPGSDRRAPGRRAGRARRERGRCRPASSTPPLTRAVTMNALAARAGGDGDLGGR